MKNWEYKEKYISIGFKSLYLILTLLSFNGLFAHTKLLRLFSLFIMIVGSIYLFLRILHLKYYKSTIGIKLLVLFVASYLLSSVLTIKFGYSENIKAIIWMCFQFFLLYATNVEHKYNIFELETIFYIILIYTILMNIIGIGMFATRYSQYVVRDSIPVHIGFLWNRLWGLYTDPNYGAVFCVISIVVSMYFVYKKKSRKNIVLCIANILFQLLYIALSDSRTGLFALIGTAVLLTLLLCLKNDRLSKHPKFFKAAFTFLLIILVALTLTLGVTLTTKVASTYQINRVVREMKKENKEVDRDKIEQEYKVGRTDDIESDVSNRRFSIWKSVFQVFKTKPMTGVSFRNLIAYAKANLPNTYIVNNDFVDFGSSHNLFFDILVSQGVLGSLIFIAFVFIIIRKIIRALVKYKNENYNHIVFLLCILFPIMISALFYSEILYINTGGSVIFWCVLGMLMQNINTLDNKETIAVQDKKTDIFSFHRTESSSTSLKSSAFQVSLNRLHVQRFEILDFGSYTTTTFLGYFCRRSVLKEPVGF